MRDALSEIDFNDVPDMFETDTFETEEPSELESFLAAARATHEDRIHAFWRRFGLEYDDAKS